jgi:thiamine-phosphate pyrophosphorylase
MRLHAIVSDLATAQDAVKGGATVIQLRLKGASTEQVVATGAAFRELDTTLVVNDDVHAAIALGADGVHLGRDDPGAEAAIAAGLLLGTSASSVDESPIGLDGLAEICGAVSIPVIAIGGIDAGNAAECIAAGAFGVAVVRAAADARSVSEALAAR